MTTKQILVAAKALIDTPEKWGRGPWREQLCIADALAKACGPELVGYTDARLAFKRMLPRGMTPPEYNDDPETTHAEVMAKFDEAIAACPDDGEEVK